MHLSEIKNITYLSAFLLGMNFESFVVLAVLMLLDTITGVIKTGRVSGWRAVNSHRLTFGIISKCLVILVPLILVWVGRQIGIDLLALANGVMAVLILAEAYSIIANIVAVRTGNEVKEFDAISLILGKVNQFLEAMLNKKIDEQPK